MHGRTGYLAKPGRAQDFADRIVTLARDPTLRRQMERPLASAALGFPGTNDGAHPRLLQIAAHGNCGVKIVDISEFYSPTGGGVRNYVDQKFKAAARTAIR